MMGLQAGELAYNYTLQLTNGMSHKPPPPPPLGYHTVPLHTFVGRGTPLRVVWYGRSL